MTHGDSSPQPAPPDAEAVTHYLLNAFDDVQTTEAMGYHFFFFGADRKLPFVTLAAADNEYDRVSNLDRPGVFRLNFGLRKETYRALFGPAPALGESGVVDTGHDFTALDQLMPHPHYAPQGWVCVLSPSAPTFRSLEPLLAEAYALAAGRHPTTAAEE
jgi:hypothetical protein